MNRFERSIPHCRYSFARLRSRSHRTCSPAIGYLRKVPGNGVPAAVRYVVCDPGVVMDWQGQSAYGAGLHYKKAAECGLFVSNECAST